MDAPAAETTPAGEVETQSEEVPKVDQSTGHPEPTEAPSSTEPVVEITPTQNGVHSQEGEEHFVEEEAPKPAEPEEEEKVETAPEVGVTPINLTSRYRYVNHG